MKIAVLGAGAMGSLYGAYLAQQEEVTLFDVYQPLVDTINQQGVTVIFEGKQTVYPVKAQLSGSHAPVQDLVIVFVKGDYTRQTLEQNRGLIDEHTLVLSLQNGGGNEENILPFVKKEQIFQGVTRINSQSEGLGVTHPAGKGVTIVGSSFGQPLPQVQKIVDVFEKNGLWCEASTDIHKTIWEKLCDNLTINALSTLLTTRVGYVRENAHVRQVAESLLKEAVAVANALGIGLEYAHVHDRVMELATTARTGHTSMWQDMRAGRKTEIDRINGYIVASGEKTGVPTPCNRMLVQLIHALEEKTQTDL